MGLTREDMALVESELRRELAGVRLVAELDLDVNGEQFKKAYSTLRQHFSVNPGAGAVKRAHETFPATMVFVFTALGQFVGGADEYWQKIQEGRDNTFEIPGLNGPNSSAYGKAFRDSLEILGLANFAHVDGRKNLVPLLLHGAIPAKDIKQVWRLVANAISNGIESGDEIVALWRKDPSHVQYLNKPVIWFVQEAGRFAEDIVQRMASALIDLSTESAVFDSHQIATRHRLPKIYVERLAEEGVGEITRRIQIPNPTIFINRYSGIGPQIRLPAVREELQEALWLVTSQETRSRRVKNFDETTVELDLAPRWSYELTCQGERLKYREYSTLTGLEVWTFTRFGDEFRIRESTNTLDNEVVYLLAPTKSKIIIVDGNVQKVVQCASDVIAFGGGWSSYALFELDLAYAKKVEVEIFGLTKREFPVVEGLPRPSIEGSQLDNLREVDGRRVFVAEPHLHFSKEVENPELFTVEVLHPNGYNEENRLSSLTMTSNGYRLSTSQLQRTGTYQVRLRGPLGSDLTDQFVLLPDAELGGLDGVFGPYEDVNGTITISGNLISSLQIIAPRRRTIFKLSCQGGAEEIQLVVSVRRIEFCINRGDYPQFNNSPKQYGRDEFLYNTYGNHVETLWIRTCMLTGPELVWLEEFKPSFKRPLNLKEIDSTIKISLAQFYEEVHSLKSPHAELQLLIPGLPPISLLAIGTDLSEAIETVRVEGAEAGYLTSLFVHLSTNIAEFARYLEVANLDEPWRANTKIELVDVDANGKCIVSTRGQVVPGEHHIRVFGVVGVRAVLLGETKTYLGDAADLKNYFDGLSTTKEDVLARVLRKGIKIFDISEDKYLLLLSDVFMFLVKNIKNRDMKNQCEAAREFVLLEGKEPNLLSWLSEKLSDESFRKDVEVLIIQLFPYMSDALRGTALQLSLNTLTRTWRASPLVGAILIPTSTSADAHLGENSTEIDFALRHEKEHWLGERADFVPSFCEIFLEYKSNNKTSTGGTSDYSHLLGFSALSNMLTQIYESFQSQNSPESNFERKSREFLSGKSKYRGPITREVRDKLFGHKIAQKDLRFCSYINYIFGLSALMLDTSVPYEASTTASELLSGEYLSSKLLVQRILLETVTTN
jgi:hypothetical protein